MSEMLGNQFFMARNYEAAQAEFEEVLLKDPFNKGAKKKIIVCYTQTGKVKNAVKYFNELISEDIKFIIDTNPHLDDCPCPELVEKIEGQKGFYEDSKDHLIILGIIWLYCDISKSVDCFLKAKALSPNDDNLSITINIIQEYLDRNPLIFSQFKKN
ncbi:MAG: tetratricopeptide repeat protein [Melioribacteraceae bacterium]